MYSKIAENIILRGGDLLMHTSFVKTLHEWRETDMLSASALADLQEQRLKVLLNHAGKNSMFYRGKGALEYCDQDAMAWLRKFPVLKKADIRQNISGLLTVPKHGLIVERSSGSSGIQGEVWMTRAEQYRAAAIQTHLWEWSGYRIGAPLLQLGITTKRSPEKALKDFFLNTNYQQAFEISSPIAEQALLSMRGKNGFFGGYASGLYVYAQLAEKLGIRDLRFQACISWGDKLFPHYRKKISDVFGAKVFDTYGCTEGFIIAGECEAGAYHLMTPHMVLELLDENEQEVQPGEIGHVVVTRLDAYAMPLIRYYLGDLAIKAPINYTCACGRAYPVLTKIVGRDTDIVATPSGKSIIVHFFTGIFEHVSQIQQFRVIQEDIKGVSIEYIPAKDFHTDILLNIEKQILDKIKEPFKVKFQEVSFIPATASGKPQIILSTIRKS